MPVITTPNIDHIVRSAAIRLDSAEGRVIASMPDRGAKFGIRYGEGHDADEAISSLILNASGRHNHCCLPNRNEA